MALSCWYSMPIEQRQAPLENLHICKSRYFYQTCICIAFCIGKCINSTWRRIIQKPCNSNFTYEWFVVNVKQFLCRVLLRNFNMKCRIIESWCNDFKKKCNFVNIAVKLIFNARAVCFMHYLCHGVNCIQFFYLLELFWINVHFRSK